MKTIGDLIKQARYKENLSRSDLGEMTHIRTEFIAAIEEANWEKLPPFSITNGFVKSIAHFLDIDENQAVSIFRRSYPPSLIKIVDKPKNFKEVRRRFSWGPRMTFIVGVLIIILIVVGYLGFQYRKFNSSPNLIVNNPTQNEIINQPEVNVNGKTDPDATVIINGQSVIVNDDGSFAAQVDVATDTKEIDITAKSRAGKVSTVARTIKVLLQ
ncbi:MAG TPA: helix-turn-helix domain-containing protein [Patescibacteria group bacterium]|nr:helix-turn-helix domain-containing protein [Patescibacteria group bacterium]